MKKNILISLSLTSLLLVGLVACMKDSSHAKQPIESQTPQLRAVAFQLIQADLSNEYQLLSVKDKSQEQIINRDIKQMFESGTDADADIERIIHRRQVLEGADITITSTSATLLPSQSTLSLVNGYIIVRAAVMYKLPTKSIDSETGNPIISEGVDYYEYTIEKKDDKYLIKEKKKVPDVIYTTESDIRIPMVESNASRAIQGSYSATNAVAFAYSYYNTPPQTGYYDYTNAGGDCTNFVSHCLKNGGWLQVNSWHWNSNGASCETNMTTCTRSPSWTGAAQFYTYLTGGGASRVLAKFADIPVYSWYSLPSTRSAFRAATSVVNKGDIVQISSTTTKSSVHHSTIVTSKDATAQQVFVTYRNGGSYPVAKDKFIGDFSGGEYLQGFSVKATF